MRYSTNDVGSQSGQPVLQTGWLVFESVNFTHQLEDFTQFEILLDELNSSKFFDMSPPPLAKPIHTHICQSQFEMQVPVQA